MGGAWSALGNTCSFSAEIDTSGIYFNQNPVAHVEKMLGKRLVLIGLRKLNMVVLIESKRVTFNHRSCAPN